MKINYNEILYNAESDKFYTRKEIINLIMQLGYTEEEANNYINNSIEQNILYDTDNYIKHFTNFN